MKNISVKSRILIIAGGEADRVFCSSFISNHEFDYVMCADSGFDYCIDMGIKADEVFGDFDSSEALSFYESDNSKAYEFTCINYPETIFHKYPPEKDMTDLEIVIRAACACKPEIIDIICASGGRADQFLSNIGLLTIPADMGILCSIYDSHNRIQMFGAGIYQFRPDDASGRYISFLPYTDKVGKVTLEGFKYELENTDLYKGSSLTVSNEYLPGKTGKLKFESGRILVIESR
ncbi:MAG: thiamine diphosphokinase [Lachnospiraceae bacterium]|nr:thiamine diphosphokinase [Lachnospiraceae bacterium]MEE3460492.1 thiamine diphosphokinase [Lachnospiraceae bacterium]